MNNFTDTQFKGNSIVDENGEVSDLHTTLKYKATIMFTQYIAPASE